MVPMGKGGWLDPWDCRDAVAMRDHKRNEDILEKHKRKVVPVIQLSTTTWRRNEEVEV
jgi:hypothetical protein